MKKTIAKWMDSIRTELTNPARSNHAKALSVAAGMFIAVSPFLGFHFLMAFALLAVCRSLDKVLVLAFTMANNWWTMVPIYGLGLWIGGLMTGQNGLDIGTVNWDMLTLTRFLNGDAIAYIATYLKPMVVPFVVGNLALAIITAAASYAIVLAILRRVNGKQPV